MHEGRKIIIPAGCLRDMTVAQFEALKDMTQPGSWEGSDDDLFVSGTDDIGTTVDGMYIGIEKDGYTHS